jgi:hypothetical protein
MVILMRWAKPMKGNPGVTIRVTGSSFESVWPLSTDDDIAKRPG